MEGFRDAQAIGPIPGLPFTVNHLSDQARGLVAWWPLSDLSGRTVECMIRAGNRGTVVRDTDYNSVRPCFVDGALGVRITENGGLGNAIGTGFTDALGDFTATCWFRLWVGSFFGRIIDKNEDNGFAIRQEFSAPDYNAKVMGTTTGTLTLTDGRPYFAAVRRLGTAVAFIINGGEKKATATVSGSTTSTQALGMGGTFAGGNQSRVELRDVRVYNRALTDHEIWALYDPVTRYELYYYLGQKTYGIRIGTGSAGSGARSQVVIIG